MGLGLVLAAQLWAAPIDLAALTLQLRALRESSPRPDACVGLDAASPKLWTRASVSSLSEYCRDLALGYAVLEGDPAAALAAAQALAVLQPGLFEPMVLEARALLAQGHFERAWTTFQQVAKQREGLLEGAETLHAMARAAALTGNVVEADRLYQRLVPRASLLGRSSARQQVLLEAALAAMGAGQALAPRVQAYLDDARRISVLGGFDAFTALSAALLAHFLGDEQRAKRWVEPVMLPLSLRLEERGEASSADGLALSARTREGSAEPLLPPGARMALAAVWYQLNPRSEDPHFGTRAWAVLRSGSAGRPWQQLAGAGP